MRVDGKVALVTGGAGGIGAAAARLLAAEGAAVLIGDILAEQGQATADTIAASGGRASFVELDVTNPQDWSNAIAQAVGQFGKLDVLVNNAGVSHRTGVGRDGRGRLGPGDGRQRERSFPRDPGRHP